MFILATIIVIVGLWFAAQFLWYIITNLKEVAQIFLFMVWLMLPVLGILSLFLGFLPIGIALLLIFVPSLAGVLLLKIPISKLWQEGKKGWLWISIIIICLAIPIGPIAIRARERVLQEQARKAEVMERSNQTVTEFQSVVNFGLPYLVSGFTRWQPEGKEIVISIAMEESVVQEYIDRYPQAFKGVFYVEPITEWSFNGETYQSFTQRNEIVGGPRNEVKGQITGYIIGNENTQFNIIVDGPDAENMKEVCIKLKAEYGGATNERLICGKIEKNT